MSWDHVLYASDRTALMTWWYVCVGCECDFHYSCAGLTADQVERVEEYHCDRCEARTGTLTSWKGTVATVSVIDDKNRHYYDVETILACKVTAAGRRFKIKWRGYTETTWEDEAHLDGCLDMLQKYLKSLGLPLSTMEAKIGATSDHDDEANFVTISDVIAVVTRYRNFGIHRTTLDIERSLEFGTEDKIFIFDVDRHCYVLLYVAPNRGFIADGLNSYLDRPATRAAVNRAIGRRSLKIRAIRFDQQIKSDHCGSSGALIILELMRAYKLDQLESIEKLIAPKVLRDQKRSILHPHASETVAHTTLTQKRQSWTCGTCGKGFRTRNAMTAHNVRGKCAKSDISKTGH